MVHLTKRPVELAAVFDGLPEMRLLSGNALIYRRQLLALTEFVAQYRATVLLLGTSERSRTVTGSRL